MKPGVRADVAEMGEIIAVAGDQAELCRKVDAVWIMVHEHRGPIELDPLTIFESERVGIIRNVQEIDILPVAAKHLQRRIDDGIAVEPRVGRAFFGAGDDLEQIVVAPFAVGKKQLVKRSFGVPVNDVLLLIDRGRVTHEERANRRRLLSAVGNDQIKHIVLRPAHVSSPSVREERVFGYQTGRYPRRARLLERQAGRSIGFCAGGSIRSVPSTAKHGACGDRPIAAWSEFVVLLDHRSEIREPKHGVGHEQRGDRPQLQDHDQIGTNGCGGAAASFYSCMQRRDAGSLRCPSHGLSLLLLLSQTTGVLPVTRHRRLAVAAPAIGSRRGSGRRGSLRERLIVRRGLVCHATKLAASSDRRRPAAIFSEGGNFVRGLPKK
jgi:hypothetical protein